MGSPRDDGLCMLFLTGMWEFADVVLAPLLVRQGMTTALNAGMWRVSASSSDCGWRCRCVCWNPQRLMLAAMSSCCSSGAPRVPQVAFLGRILARRYSNRAEPDNEVCSRCAISVLNQGCYFTRAIRPVYGTRSSRQYSRARVCDLPSSSYVCRWRTDVAGIQQTAAAGYNQLVEAHAPVRDTFALKASKNARPDQPRLSVDDIIGAFCHHTKPHGQPT